MDKKYEVLLDSKKLKREFLVELYMELSGFAKSVAKAKWELYSHYEYSQFLQRYRRYVAKGEPILKHLQAEYDKWVAKYDTLAPMPVHQQLFISEEEWYLLDKIDHIINSLEDFAGAVRMLRSLKNGPKRLKSNNRSSDHEGMYNWVEKDGNEKLAHTGNLPKGHFVWNYGKRYTLSQETVDCITEFIGE